MSMFSKRRFLFSCLVILRIIKTITIGIYSMVLKVCDEIELTLKRGAGTTIPRNEVHSSNNHGLGSIQSLSESVDKDIKPATINFVISNIPTGKSVTVRHVNRRIVFTSVEDISQVSINKIQKRELAVKGKSPLKFDGSGTLIIPVSSHLDQVPFSSQGRNMRIEFLPEIRGSQDTNQACRSKIVSTTVESPVCKSSIQNCGLKLNEQNSESEEIQLCSSKEDYVGTDDTSLEIRNDENTKIISTSIKKDFASPHFTDSQGHLDTNKGNNNERKVFHFSAAADLRKHDTQPASSSSSIKDGEAKDGVLKDELRNFIKIQSMQEKGSKNVERKENKSSNISTSEGSQPQYDKKEAFTRDVKAGKQAYMDYLIEMLPILESIEDDLLMLCKKHYKKSVINKKELVGIHSGLQQLHDRSKQVNSRPYQSVVNIFLKELKSIVVNFRSDIENSRNKANRMKCSFFTNKLIYQIENNRNKLFVAQTMLDKIDSNMPEQRTSKRC